MGNRARSCYTDELISTGKTDSDQHTHLSDTLILHKRNHFCAKSKLVYYDVNVRAPTTSIITAVTSWLPTAGCDRNAADAAVL